MDRKTIILIAACFTLLLLWPQLVRKAFPPTKLPPGATNKVATATASTTGSTTATTGVSTSSTSSVTTATNTGVAAAAPSTTSTVIPSLDTNAPEQLLVLTNNNARYTFTSRGGGLKQVELLHYPESVSALRKKKSSQSQELATLNEAMPLPAGALLDDGTAAGDGVFQLSPTATGVRAEKMLANGLSVLKEFSLGSNYVVTVNVRLQNGGSDPLALPAREILVGSATPLGPRDNGQFIGVSWYDGAKQDETARQAWFDNRSFLSCLTRAANPRTEYRGGSNNVVWAAAYNQFFTWVAMPESPAVQVVVQSVALPKPADAPAQSAVPRGFQTALLYPATSLAAGQAQAVTVHLFAGPKEYRTLAAVSEQFHNNADLVMGYSGFFGAFAKGLLLAMNGLHDFLKLPYGWAIVMITFIIKMVFWPLTAASTRSMKRMSALQPQMKAIQEKYKDDPAKMNRKTMEFMREHKINPIGGCLPLLIQMPIFIGFYRMIQSAIELRGAPFLWIGDLSNPDTLFIIPGLGFVPFIGIPDVGLPVNLLPLIMGATQIWQMRLTPPSPGMDPAQQRMMRYMPLMFIVILYNFSAGLTLYWTVQNLLSIAQTKFTKQDPKDPLLALHPKKVK